MTPTIADPKWWQAARPIARAFMADHLWNPGRRTAAALARAVMPGGTWLPAADEAVADRAAALLRGFGAGALPAWVAGLAALELAPMPRHRGRPFSRLRPEEAERFVARWLEGGLAQRALLELLSAPLKLAYFGAPAIYERLGATFCFRAAREPAPQAWARQVIRGAELRDQDLECDVVVIGTGAGGAVVAKELAEQGHAVLMLEEGEYLTRADFDGRPLESMQRLYQQGGRLAAVGNCFVMIPAGRLVGGSTAVNTGTCWRTPEWVLDQWVRAGLRDLSAAQLAPRFARVEAMLRVEVADERHMGGVARVVRQGAEALGYSHRPLRRCAPECDGAGVCDWGCPTDAKLGTNLTYVPAALKQGATLVTGARALRVEVSGGRAVGVVARLGASGRPLRVRARATLLAGGALRTPLLLGRLGLGRALPQLGRNLSLHPATTVSALVDDEVRGYAAMPQGYCVDHLHREGILILGASAPIDLGAVQLGLVGAPLMEVMAAYDHVCSMGVMVEDGPHGRVWEGPRGAILASYWLGRAENERLLRGTALLARIYLAAGARAVYPAVRGHRVLRSEADVRRLEEARPGGFDWLLAGFHPLGTCRMATSVREGVVSPAHEVFGLRDLFVADGSVVPSPPAVNPQETIMALATRAAEIIAARLDGSGA